MIDKLNQLSLAIALNQTNECAGLINELIADDQQLRRELDEAKAKNRVQDEQYRQHIDRLQERIAILEAELKAMKEERKQDAKFLEGENANPEICFEDFYDTDE